MLSVQLAGEGERESLWVFAYDWVEWWWRMGREWRAATLPNKVD